MLTFLKIFFLGASFSLQPEPVDIGAHPVRLSASEPVTALTDGAYLAVSVSAEVPQTGVLPTLSRVASRFPNGCVEAVARTVEGKTIHLARQGASVSEDNVYLTFRSTDGYPKRTKIAAFFVSSCSPIPHASGTWHNAQK